MNHFDSDPFCHSRAEHLCPHCGAPDLPGVSCLCVSYLAAPCCLTCGSDTADLGEASCPTCRRDGRVEESLVSMLDAWDFPLKRKPTDPRRVEEPLSIKPVPPARKSWRPAAA